MLNTAQKSESTCKVVFLGDVGVGKSTIAYRMRSGVLVSDLTPTIAAGYLCMERDGMKLNIWDSSGSERFSRLLPMYVRGAQIIVLTYDLSHPYTVEKVEDYYARFLDELPEIRDATWFVVGNKSDLCTNCVNVMARRGQEFATKHDLKHFSISAYTGENVTELLDCIFAAAKKQNTVQDEKIVRLTPVDSDQAGDEKLGKLLERWNNCCS